MRFHGKTGADGETDVHVPGRFYDSLDHHFYHYYRLHPERRMAICEVIEF